MGSSRRPRWGLRQRFTSGSTNPCLTGSDEQQRLHSIDPSPRTRDWLEGIPSRTGVPRLSSSAIGTYDSPKELEFAHRGKTTDGESPAAPWPQGSPDETRQERPTEHQPTCAGCCDASGGTGSRSLSGAGARPQTWTAASSGGPVGVDESQPDRERGREERSCYPERVNTWPSRWTEGAISRPHAEQKIRQVNPFHHLERKKNLYTVVHESK